MAQAQAKFPAEPRDSQGRGVPDHSWAAESLLLSVDEEDLEAITENLRSNAAAATSGLSNDTLAALIKGEQGPDNMHGLTTMFNLIIRGWITKADMDIIRKCRGIALDKGNYENDDSNWRPICIREAR